MVFVGLKVDCSDLSGWQVNDVEEDLFMVKGWVRENAEKQVAKMLFDVRVLEGDVGELIVYKKFLAETTMMWLYGLMLVGGVLAFAFFGVLFPFYVAMAFLVLWAALESPVLNYLLLRRLVKKAGVKGKIGMMRDSWVSERCLSGSGRFVRVVMMGIFTQRRLRMGCERMVCRMVLWRRFVVIAFVCGSKGTVAWR